MSSNHKTGSKHGPAFSFGVRELRQAQSAQQPGLDSSPLKIVDENHGVDPYNTSGSFDRNKNWARIGKR